MVESLLDQVPGLGEVRRKALISYFGSLKKLREAEVADIAQVPGIGPTTAAAIKEAVAATTGTRQTVSVTPSFNAATGEIVDDS